MSFEIPLYPDPSVTYPLLLLVSPPSIKNSHAAHSHARTHTHTNAVPAHTSSPKGNDMEKSCRPPFRRTGIHPIVPRLDPRPIEASINGVQVAR